MARRSGLGKGLNALIPDSDPSEPQAGQVQQVEIERIIPNPRQPREHFDPDQLAELAASIREHGIIQPLVVSPGENGNYILIAGERRLQAARQAGLRRVPVILRETTDQQRLELALIENIQRADLNPLEEAEAYRHLAEEFGLSHEAIARRVGKSRTAISNTLRLLQASSAVRQAVLQRKISEGHARALLGLPTTAAQDAALQTVLRENLNVRQTEALVRKLSGHRPERRPLRPPSPDLQALEERLQAALGTRVTLRHGRKGGSVTIHYYSEEELEALLSRLLAQ